MMLLMSDNKPMRFEPGTLPANGRAGVLSRSDHVAHAIGQRIVAGDLPPGSQLPTEHQLCEEIGVSRSALREGFRLLAARGMIVSRRKTGTTVAPMANWSMMDAWVLGWHLEQGPTDRFIDSLFEVRSIVEPAACLMAAQRATPAEVNAIVTALAAMIDAQAGPANGRAEPGAGEAAINEVVEADLLFHKAILAAAGNAFLATFGTIIGSSLYASFRLNWQAHNTPPALSLQQHQDVSAAIEARRPAEASRRMLALLASAHADARAALALRGSNACCSQRLPLR